MHQIMVRSHRKRVHYVGHRFHALGSPAEKAARHPGQFRSALWDELARGNQWAGLWSGQPGAHDFERSGVMIVTTRGNQRLYRTNMRHPVYPDLRAICLKTFGAADTIAVELSAYEQRIALAFIFGSVARGTERADSDLDLLVVGSPDYLELGLAIERHRAAIGRPTDLNPHTEQEWERRKDESVIRSILEGERLVDIKGTLDFRKAVRRRARRFSNHSGGRLETQRCSSSPASYHRVGAE